MPYRSNQERKAMFAAASGKSTLGIPQSVGQEFVKAGPASPNLPDKVAPNGKKMQRARQMKKRKPPVPPMNSGGY